MSRKSTIIKIAIILGLFSSCFSRSNVVQEYVSGLELKKNHIKEYTCITASYNQYYGTNDTIKVDSLFFDKHNRSIYQVIKRYHERNSGTWLLNSNYQTRAILIYNEERGLRYIIVKPRSSKRLAVKMLKAYHFKPLDFTVFRNLLGGKKTQKYHIGTRDTSIEVKLETKHHIYEGKKYKNIGEYYSDTTTKYSSKYLSVLVGETSIDSFFYSKNKLIRTSKFKIKTKVRTTQDVLNNKPINRFVYKNDTLSSKTNYYYNSSFLPDSVVSFDYQLSKKVEYRLPTVYNEKTKDSTRMVGVMDSTYFQYDVKPSITRYTYVYE